MGCGEKVKGFSIGSSMNVNTCRDEGNLRGLGKKSGRISATTNVYVYGSLEEDDGLVAQYAVPPSIMIAQERIEPTNIDTGYSPDGNIDAWLCHD
jgi:hypothetical protein